VFFGVGETIVDESREYGTWADWLGVPRHTFSAVFGWRTGRPVCFAVLEHLGESGRPRRALVANLARTSTGYGIDSGQAR
jgi:hypothetical protein